MTPRASAERIAGVAADEAGIARLKLAVTAAPEAGRANDAVIRLLAKSWGWPKTAFVLRAGAAGRRKTVHVAGDYAALAGHLDRWLDRWLDPVPGGKS